MTTIGTTNTAKNYDNSTTATNGSNNNYWHSTEGRMLPCVTRGVAGKGDRKGGQDRMRCGCNCHQNNVNQNGKKKILRETKYFQQSTKTNKKKKDDWNTLEMFFIVLGRANEMLDECKWKKVGNTRWGKEVSP